MIRNLLMNRDVRIIARIDVKNEYVIKGIHLEGLRKIGNPLVIADKYYHDGIDEIIFMDAVASLYDRNNLFHIIENACHKIFVPITIGGGLRSIQDVEKALHAGADKVAINTQLVKTPELATQVAKNFGSQCLVGSIEAKKKGTHWEAYVDNGREVTGKNAIEWAKQLEDLGVGEILVTSIDKEGTKNGFDDELMQRMAEAVSVPLIASGGCGKPTHINSVCENSEVSAVALASVLHYNISTISNIKQSCSETRLQVRI